MKTNTDNIDEITIKYILPIPNKKIEYILLTTKRKQYITINNDKAKGTTTLSPTHRLKKKSEHANITMAKIAQEINSFLIFLIASFIHFQSPLE